MDVRIPRRRRCKNNCNNFAIRQEGRDNIGKTCAECLAKRRERQRLTASQPNCRCGNKMSIGAQQCRGCDWKDEQAQIAKMRRREQLKSDLGYIAENDPQAIEYAFNSLMRRQVNSLRQDYP